MNGDEVRAIVSEVASLKAVIEERARGVDLFRHELRESFHDVKGAITDHAAEDTRRFEKVDTALDQKITGLWEHLEAQANAQRTRAWQITGIALTAFFGLAGVLIAVYKAGLL